jgi:hypothetical protein
VTEAGFTQEELALLGHSELAADESSEHDAYDERPSLPAGFRERLALGDLSW